MIQAGILEAVLKAFEIEAGDAAAHADAFDRLRAGDVQAIVVHGVYGSSALARVVDRLERHDPPFLKTSFPEKFRASFFGRNLNLAHPSLAGYFGEAATFDRQLDELFAPEESLRQRVCRILSQLDNGRAFGAAPGPRMGEHYMFTTLRAHLEGGYIPPHYDNEQALVPAFSHLRTRVQLHMTSFVLTLQPGHEGGALELYEHRCEPEQATSLRSAPGLRPDVSGVPSTLFRVPAGAMIVVDSGRYLHRVTPVQGRRTRWTACSFMALAHDGAAMYCWG